VRTIVFLTAVVAAGVLATTAAAAPPTITKSGTFTGTSTLTGVCSFPVEVTFSQTFTEIDYFDSSGNLTRVFIHAVEQDVFTANGKTVRGEPFTFNTQVLFDSEGNVTHVYASGIVERIILPGGDLFLSAGRLDFAAHPGQNFLISPDVGAQGNIAGFCAALS
jgi:hypothetical protein